MESTRGTARRGKYNEIHSKSPKNNFPMSSSSDFKTHLSYALGNSPLGSRREFTAPQGNNAIETSELLGFSFHDHTVTRELHTPPYRVLLQDRTCWSCAYSSLPLEPNPVHVTPTIIPYFKRVPPPASDWDPDRNTNQKCDSELDSDSGYDSDDYSDYLL
jgi:hypothetical protein